MTDLSALVADLTRLQAAAPEDEWSVAQVLDRPDWDGRVVMCGSEPLFTTTPERAVLIVASRNALPHLLARLAQLEEALETACDVAVWMSGSPSFSPEGEAHEGWVSARERLFKAMEVRGVARLDTEETP